MPIKTIEPIRVAYQEPNDDGATRHLCLVRIIDSSGAVGWGEAVTMWPEASTAVAGLIDSLALLLVGRSAHDNAQLWDDMIEHTWWYGRGGSASMAVAALDIALWDLRGKLEDTPLVEMLGGSHHTSLPVIASGHATHADLNQLVDKIAGWTRDDISGVKVGFGKRGDAHLGYEHDRDVEFVARLRSALGPDKHIMIDIGHAVRWDVDTAIKRAQAFDDYNIAWLEEPLGWHNPEGYATLAASTKTRIAYGEREWTYEGIERILSTGTVDVIGIDPGRLEGVTGFHRAGRLIADHGKTLNAHAWSSSIVTAASLAISLNNPTTWVFETKPLENPMQHELALDPVVPLEGRVSALSGAGLGVTIDMSVVDRYRY